MPDSLSPTAANAALTALFHVRGLYLACHTSTPAGSSEPSATEVAGGGYFRQPISFSSASGRTVKSTRAQLFIMPSATVTYLVVWNAPSGGQYLGALALSPALHADDHGSLVVPAGDVAFSI